MGIFNSEGGELMSFFNANHVLTFDEESQCWLYPPLGIVVPVEEMQETIQNLIADGYRAGEALQDCLEPEMWSITHGKGTAQ